MRTTLKFIALVGFAATLSACGQSEPEPVTFVPTYNKVGEPSCPVGTTLSTDGAGGDICVSA